MKNSLEIDHAHVLVRSRRTGNWRVCGKTYTERRIESLERALVMAAEMMPRELRRSFYARMRDEPRTAMLAPKAS
jgi:hypothetical protein